MNKSSIIISKNFRMYLCKKYFKRILLNTKLIQKYYRNYKKKILVSKVLILQKFIRNCLFNKKKYQEILNKSSITIQKNYNRYIQKKKYNSIKKRIIFIQRTYRKNNKSKNIIIEKNNKLKIELEKKRKFY